MKKYITEIIKENKYLENHRDILNYKANTSIYPIIEELQLAPSRIAGLEREVYMAGDCGSCPSCACINADVQFLAVIEAPATVPLLVTVGGIRFAS